MVECHYIDYKTARDSSLLARTAEQLPKQPNILSTCHRVELYGGSEVVKPEFLKGKDVTVVTQLPRVIERLTSIAAGIESEIMGEWAIEQQVGRFVDGLDASDKTKDLAEVCLQLASDLRKEHDFYGPDHADLALKEVRRGTQSKVLLVFGAGMVGKSLAESYEKLGYSDMILITRNRRKAKKRIKALNPSQIVTLESLDSKIAGAGKFDVLVATTDIEDGYGQSIHDYVVKNCDQGVVDVSALPVIGEDRGAVTLCSAKMAEFIAIHNASFAGKYASIKEKIGFCADRLAQDLTQKWQY